MPRLGQFHLTYLDTVYLGLDAALATVGITTIALADAWRESGNGVLQLLEPVARLESASVASFGPCCERERRRLTNL